MADLTTHPLTPDRWEDLVTVFGGGEGKGDCGRCWCMWWRLPRASVDELGKQNKALFKKRVDAGPPPGLIGYDADDVPVGWVQVGPRADVPNWNQTRRLSAPLDPADASDPDVWGISCFVVRVGFRRKGHLGGLLDAAIELGARQQRARARCLPPKMPAPPNGRRRPSAGLGALSRHRIDVSHARVCGTGAAAPGSTADAFAALGRIIAVKRVAGSDRTCRNRPAQVVGSTFTLI